MTYDELLSAEHMSSILGYDPQTGVFWWLVSPAKNIRAGTQAGCVKMTRTHRSGEACSYRYIRTGGHNIPAARIAWLLTEGEWPQSRVIFRDGDPLNLKFENLGLATMVMRKYSDGMARTRIAYNKENREQNPREWKDAELRNKFGISLHEYGKMLVAQGGVCAICKNEESDTRNGTVKALAVDHDHKTGKVRALLCAACNTGLGKFMDDSVLLRAAAEYLDIHLEEEKNVLE